jgi:hypothetical protein
MNLSMPFGKVLLASPFKGNAMLIVVILAVVTPTLLRLGMDGMQGDGFCPYLPFVTFAAMVLEWRAAAIVAVASGLLADYLFEGARYQLFEMPDEITGFVYFCAAAALIIGLAQAFRKTVADPLWFDAPGPTSKGLVFSRRAGQACVSWYGGRTFVPLGPADEVEAKMRDFLAQQELGRRLSREKPV